MGSAGVRGTSAIGLTLSRLSGSGASQNHAVNEAWRCRALQHMIKKVKTARLCAGSFLQAQRALLPFA